MDKLDALVDVVDSMGWVEGFFFNRKAAGEAEATRVTARRLELASVFLIALSFAVTALF